MKRNRDVSLKRVDNEIPIAYNPLMIKALDFVI